MLPAQHGWRRLPQRTLVPQATHDPPLQVSVALLQVLPPQQA